MHNPPVNLRRRDFVSMLALGASRGAVASNDPLADRLRAGGCVVLLRHARTTPGVGDPSGFRLDSCSTQRNLSEEGRAQARAVGAWFRNLSLRPGAVRSSAWCRCRDTAALAFGAHETWPPLNSTFGNSAGPDAAAATQALRAALARLPTGAFEVWVTHQVNISALTGEFTEMGEGLVVDTAVRTVARSRFA
jgi:broad specificity phosphatase PhoE